MNKYQRRRQKGRIVSYYPAIIIRGKRRGQYKDKTIREYCLHDVIGLRNRGASRKEIHDYLCDTFGFVDDNPVEDRYLGYIKDHNLK